MERFKQTPTERVEQYKKDLLTDVPPIESKEILEYIRMKLAEIPVVTVKFSSKDNEVFTQTYAQSTSILEVKEVLQTVFNFPAELIELRHDSNVLEDNLKLLHLDSGIHNTLDFVMISKDSHRTLSAKYAYKDLTVPDIITVTVTYDDGSTKEIVVEIEDRAILKPYLGGYINTITQIEYNHGYTQSGPPPPKLPLNRRSNRDTQTYIWRHRRLETRYERATQMSREDHYMPSVTDKILIPRVYETAVDREVRLDIDGKVRTIQRYYHAWKMRKCLKALAAEYQKRVDLEQQELDFIDRTNAIRKNRELIGKIFPRTKADFYMLYTMLENWKKSELKRIKLIACGPSRIAEMYLLLEREIEMLLGIERQKETAKRDKQIKREIEFLKTISEPIVWNSAYKNVPVKMDTYETQRGRQFYELYQALCDNSGGMEGRLKVYAEIQEVWANHSNCEVGLELISLVQRACVLVSRGISDDHLEMLQKRIEACMLQHLRLKECCDGVAMRKERVREKMMRDNLFYCIRCNLFKSHDEFEMQANTTHLQVCISCSWSDRVMEPWLDIQPYRYLLKCIRREERRHSSHSSIAFIITDKDVHHIITQIWHSHSAINECADIYKLRLCRFFKDCDWAPWNCVLLTYEETKAHLNVRDLAAVYDQEFLCHVRNKHTLSKKYFKGAITLHNYFQEIGDLESRWDEIIDKKEFVAVNSKVKIFLSCH